MRRTVGANHEIWAREPNESSERFLQFQEVVVYHFPLNGL
jgi:hypothetical protein